MKTRYSVPQNKTFIQCANTLLSPDTKQIQGKLYLLNQSNSVQQLPKIKEIISKNQFIFDPRRKSPVKQNIPYILQQSEEILKRIKEEPMELKKPTQKIHRKTNTEIQAEQNYKTIKVSLCQKSELNLIKAQEIRQDKQIKEKKVSQLNKEQSLVTFTDWVVDLYGSDWFQGESQKYYRFTKIQN